MIINIPTLNDTKSDFLTLFDIAQQCESLVPGDEVSLDFSKCKFLRPNAIVFLGGLTKVLKGKNIQVIFLLNTFKEKVLEILKRNGFAEAFEFDKRIELGQAIPYREDIENNSESITNYLSDSWLKYNWIHISDKLKNRIVSRLWEIYNNVFEHSKSSVGAISCGQYLPKKKELLLSVVDFGIGIPQSVKNFIITKGNEPTNADSYYLQLAFRPGFTSLFDNNIPRGMGLGILKDFIDKNEGKLEIYSNNSYALSEKDNESFSDNHKGFQGTIVHVTLKCDEGYYKLISEV